jgi:hypothetical protein
MKQSTTTRWREATELEAKLYWEKVDEYSGLMQKGLDTSNIPMFQRGQHKKRLAVTLLTDAGYKVDGSGIWMKVEPDILDTTFEQVIEDAAAQDYGLAMIAMRFGPTP